MISDPNQHSQNCLPNRVPNPTGSISTSSGTNVVPVVPTPTPVVVVVPAVVAPPAPAPVPDPVVTPPPPPPPRRPIRAPAAPATPCSPVATRILLAWEGGAGRGHIVTLKSIANALGPGFVYDAALCRMDHAGEIAPLCEKAFPAARLWPNRSRREAAGGPRASTWGEFLGDLNFWDTEFLVTQIGWWMATIRARASAMVIGDFSPCAMLAARILGVPAVAVGTGYSTPPAGMDAYPVLIEGFEDRIFPEAELLDALNRALVRLGGEPLTRLSDIHAGVTLLPRTIAGLDPYADRRSGRHLPPLNEALVRTSGAGEEIFVYFSSAEPDNAAMLAGFAGLGVPVRAFLPASTRRPAPSPRRPASSSNLPPWASRDIARRTRLFVHFGQHGSLCMGLGMGLAQVAIPQHLEHLYHAAARRGSGQRRRPRRLRAHHRRRPCPHRRGLCRRCRPQPRPDRRRSALSRPLRPRGRHRSRAPAAASGLSAAN